MLSRRFGYLSAIALSVILILSSCSDSAVQTRRVKVKDVVFSSLQYSFAIGSENSSVLANVEPANATNKKIKYSTKDIGIIGVDPDTGLIQTKNIGTAIVTATSVDGSRVATCEVRVTPVNVSRVEIQNRDVNMRVGDTVQIRTKVYPANATNQSLSYKVPLDYASIISVNANTGELTALGVGNAEVEVSAKENSSISDKVSVAVEPKKINVTNIEINVNSLSGQKGKSARVPDVIISPDNTTTKNILWYSSDIRYVSLSYSSSDGNKYINFNEVTEAPVAVYAVADDDNRCTAVLNVTVIN